MSRPSDDGVSDADGEESDRDQFIPTWPVGPVHPPEREHRQETVEERKDPHPGPRGEGEPLVVHSAKKPEPEIPEKVECPDYAHLLPDEIAPFTTGGVYGGDEGEDHLSFTQGGGHGGSHPHLAHQFIELLRGNGEGYPNAPQSANITCTGILAHESAQQGGKMIPLPPFTLTE